MTKEAKENIQSWIKIIIISVLIPIISVYASFRVLEYRMDRQESELNKKVDAVWYEQYITNQSKLIKRLEDDSKTRDENIIKDIEVIQKDLKSLIRSKQLASRTLDTNNKN
jgi:hypothetical protein